MSLINILDTERQFFKSAQGVPAGITELPLTHSVCKYVTANDAPLAINSAANSELVKDNDLVKDLGIQTYCGVPLHDEDGHVLGAFCVMDFEERLWTDADVAVLVDLAEIVRAEMLLRSALERERDLERERSDMLAILAHDLRSPLGAITMAATTLSKQWERLPDESRTTLISMLQRQSGNATNLVDRLLTAEGNQSQLGAEPLDVTELIEEMAGARRTAYPDLTVRVDEPESCPAVVDPVLLRQVIGNLVDNAAAHAGPAVTVRLSATTSVDEFVVSVADDGAGIAADRIEGIFDRFNRGVDSRGHGLGLHIVARLTQAMGGTVEVVSALGVGTTFRLHLPLTPPAPPSDADGVVELADSTAQA